MFRTSIFLPVFILILLNACNRCELKVQDFAQEGLVNILVDTSNSGAGYLASERDTILVRHKYHINRQLMNTEDTFIETSTGKYFRLHKNTGKDSGNIQLQFAMDNMADTVEIDIAEYNYRITGITALLLKESGCNKPTKILKKYISINNIQADLLKNLIYPAGFSIENGNLILKK